MTQGRLAFAAGSLALVLTPVPFEAQDPRLGALDGTSLFPLTPCRVIDTRLPNGPLGGPALVAGADRVFALNGVCGIPSDAKAVSVNVAVTGASAGGNLRLHPGGTAVPLVSTVNYVAGQTRSNNAVVALSASGELAAFVGGAGGTVDFILDVNGYFATPSATAFRMNDLDFRDPHFFVNFLGCRDVTDTPLVGFSVNGEVQTNIQTDGNSDGLLDLSIAAVFRPLDQSVATNPLEIHFPACTTPFASTTCSRTPASALFIPATATNMTVGQCLSAIAGTTRPYMPAITNPSAPCFSSNPVTLTMSLGGIPIALQEGRIAATYVGAPAGNLVNGLLSGFLSEAYANSTILPASLPLVGGQPLSSLLPGGNGNCAPFSDIDINAGVSGWWFYLNFTASRRTWVDN